MITEQFQQRLRQAFPFAPSQGQEQLLYAVSRMICSDKDRCTLVIKGYAGTGKTTSVSAIVKALDQEGISSVLLAPTGRAAKVLSKYTKRPASTIHRRIYAKKVSNGGMSFELAANTLRNAVFIVDEASMIGRSQGASEGNFNFRDLLEDLIEYVFSQPNSRLILIGDGAQLPPIGVDVSPALDLQVLRSEFYLTVAEIELTEVVRQAAESGILANATALREEIRKGSTAFPQLFPTSDVIRLDGQMLQDALEEEITSYGRENVLVITRSNKAANNYNQQIRVRVHWLEDRISSGDLMMVVKNNYHWGDKKRLPFLANGEVGTVRYVDESSLEERYGLQYMDVEIEFLDNRQEPYLVSCKVVLNLLQEKTPQLSNDMRYKVQQARNAEYHGLPQKEANEAIQKDPYINALEIKYGHAVTGHKSQGGQWQNAIIGFEPDYGQDPVAYLRWTYTVFTRAEERVFLLDCPFVEM